MNQSVSAPSLSSMMVTSSDAVPSDSAKIWNRVIKKSHSQSLSLDRELKALEAEAKVLAPSKE